LGPYTEDDLYDLTKRCSGLILDVAEANAQLTPRLSEGDCKGIAKCMSILLHGSTPSDEKGAVKKVNYLKSSIHKATKYRNDKLVPRFTEYIPSIEMLQCGLWHVDYNSPSHLRYCGMFYLPKELVHPAVCFFYTKVAEDLGVDWRKNDLSYDVLRAEIRRRMSQNFLVYTGVDAAIDSVLVLQHEYEKFQKKQTPGTFEELQDRLFGKGNDETKSPIRTTHHDGK